MIEYPQHSQLSDKYIIGKIADFLAEDLPEGDKTTEGIITESVTIGAEFQAGERLVFAGEKICEGSISPKDILRIKGASRVQEYLVEAIQEVYQVQGVAINDKHIEVIVKQMMQKVVIENAGNTEHLPGDRVSKNNLKHSRIIILNLC